jgi:tRNA G18 (ribose-2'-O)-methylase SpoU
VVLLHDVSNPDNVGAIFRTAAAFRTGAVALTASCASPLYRKAIRTSLGATLTVPFAHAGDGPDLVRAVREAGYTVVAFTLAPGAVALDTFLADGAPGPLALLFGSEGHGLDPATVAAADAQVTIPIDPAVDSLNVAAAAAIALYCSHPRRLT